MGWSSRSENHHEENNFSPTMSTTHGRSREENISTVKGWMEGKELSKGKEGAVIGTEDHVAKKLRANEELSRRTLWSAV